MSKVFLVGVDCSECSDRALGYAAKVAEKAKVQMIVAHVIDWSPFTFNTPKQIDLLTLQGVKTETLLSEIPIEAEIYSEIRLVVDDSFPQSFIELSDGSMHDLKVPSGSSSGLSCRRSTGSTG